MLKWVDVSSSLSQCWYGDASVLLMAQQSAARPGLRTGLLPNDLFIEGGTCSE